jgi:PTH1 family peptidyl-tRNA hydrolase
MRAPMPASDLLLVLIGLGNPGPDRAGTRHNAGHMFAEYLRARHRFGTLEPVMSVPVLAARGEIDGMGALLVLPETSMNECGRVLDPLRKWLGVDPPLWAIAYDDLDVPLGGAKGRQKGGAGGHNGVRSVLEASGDLSFFRIKLGVDSPRKRDFPSVKDYLLSDFEPDERAQLEAAFPAAEDVLRGQMKMLAARAAKVDRRREACRRFEAELLAPARAALDGLPVTSPYPILLGRADGDRLPAVVTALAKLLRKAGAEAAENEELRGRLASFIPEDLRPLVPAPRPAAKQRLFFAADLHLADGRMKVVELNCAVGYGHYAALAGAALMPVLEPALGPLRWPVEGEFAAFLFEHGLRPLCEPDRGVVAFLRGFGGQDMFNIDELERLAARVAELSGLDVPLCHEGDLTPGPDGLHLADGRRVDLLYVEENLGEWRLAGDALRDAVQTGRVKTFPALDTFLYTSKGFLSVLCEADARDWLAPDDEESKVMRENLLWSSPLDARIEPAAYHMLEQGLPLVVKDALGGGGRGVTILRPDSSSQQAGHLLRRRMLDGGSVVQGYFEAGRWSEDSDLRFDLRVLAAAHAGDVTVGPVYGRVFRGEKANFTTPDAGVAPVYVLA